MYNSDSYEQWFKATNHFMGPMNSLYQKTTDMLEQVREEHLNMLSENFSLLSDQCKRLAQAKKPEEYLTTIQECMKENANTTIQQSQKMLQSVVENVETCLKTCGCTQGSGKTTTKEQTKEHGYKHYDKDRVK